jgi:hypothetical protein
MATLSNGFQGIIVYTIHKDGCLNGLYYATGKQHGYTYNEIAKKTDEIPNPEDKDSTYKPEPIVGIYVCSWIDDKNNINNGELHIAHRNNQGIFEVDWKVKGKAVFKGTGFLLDDKTFAVHYTYAK